MNPKPLAASTLLQRYCQTGTPKTELIKIEDELH
jgi:hypothetical protein